MKRMLINATQPEELRVAIVDGQILYNLDIETPGKEQKKSNIYKGKITRIEPSLEAAFVDYGADRHGFLPLKGISRQYFLKNIEPGNGRILIQEVIKEGQEVIVQIDKEERGNKGAALTTFISLAGRYLVLMPNNPRAGGISRRIEGQERNDLRQAMGELEIPDGMGLIIRTAGIGKDEQDLQWDLDYLLQLWTAIEAAVESRPAPFLIHQESDVIIRSIRDHLSTDIGEIIIDHPVVFDRARQFMELVMPTHLKRLQLYRDDTPLFSRYQIESQIESAFRREVRLPSGGAIVIDHTEALTAIDVNSAKATKGGDIEETALQTNLEAVEEIARQLRLRDLGGLFVIDFIDMTPVRNQRDVETRLRDCLKLDRARVQTGRISRFGLLEMSRQRIRPSLAGTTQSACPRCQGSGSIRSIESMALSVLRLMEEESMKTGSARILATVPVDIATFLLNEKRRSIESIEDRNDVQIIIIPSPHMERPEYRIERIRVQDTANLRDDISSHELIPKADTETVDYRASQEPVKIEEPMVRNIQPASPPPQREERPQRQQLRPEMMTTAPPATHSGSENVIKRLWTRILDTLASSGPATPQALPAEPAASPAPQASEPTTSDSSGASGQPQRQNRRPTPQPRSPHPHHPQRRVNRGYSAPIEAPASITAAVPPAATDDPEVRVGEAAPPGAAQPEQQDPERRSRSRNRRRGGSRRSGGNRAMNQPAEAVNHVDEPPVVQDATQERSPVSEAPQETAPETTAQDSTQRPGRSMRRGHRRTISRGVRSANRQHTGEAGDAAPAESDHPATPTESRPVESRPVESRPAEQRPVETAPAAPTPPTAPPPPNDPAHSG